MMAAKIPTLMLVKLMKDSGSTSAEIAKASARAKRINAGLTVVIKVDDDDEDDEIERDEAEDAEPADDDEDDGDESDDNAAKAKAKASAKAKARKVGLSVRATDALVTRGLRAVRAIEQARKVVKRADGAERRAAEDAVYRKMNLKPEEVRAFRKKQRLAARVDGTARRSFDAAAATAGIAPEALKIWRMQGLSDSEIVDAAAKLAKVGAL